MDGERYENSFKQGAKQRSVYFVLKDQKWHCRECEYEHVGTTQIAGSGGIKGLRNGTRSRDGLEIDSGRRHCQTCNKKTMQDRWTGVYIPAIPTGLFPREFSRHVFELFEHKDVVELTTRPPSHLTIDHKLPRIRWNSETGKMLNDYSTMQDEDILAHFQLLKRSNGAVNHNLLKSRACEKCCETGRRGTPFGIRFFYAGNARWEPADKTDPGGCIGCGWYDFAEWRKELNHKLEISGGWGG